MGDTVKIEPNLQSGANEFLYVESKRARLDREKEERKRKLEVQLDFAPEDIALATVPGLEFDPKTRAFDMEELRPQPIIKKRKKNSVPEDLKDDKYWEKRNKNKEAGDEIFPGRDWELFVRLVLVLVVELSGDGVHPVQLSLHVIFGWRREFFGAFLCPLFEVVESLGHVFDGTLCPGHFRHRRRAKQQITQLHNVFVYKLQVIQCVSVCQCSCRVVKIVLCALPM